MTKYSWIRLQADLLLTKLVDKFYKELTITLMIKSIALYTDSIITLFWITREELKKIRELSGISMWCHVSTSINPVGIISMGCLNSKLSGFSFGFVVQKFYGKILILVI